MKNFKDAIIDFFHKDAEAKKLYTKVAKAQAFDDASLAEGKKYLGVVVKTLTNKLANYQVGNYGSQTDFDHLGK